MELWLRLEVGWLMLRRVREIVRRCAFHGYRVDYYEDNGWLSKTVILKGSPANVRIVRRVLETTVGLDA